MVIIVNSLLQHQQHLDLLLTFLLTQPSALKLLPVLKAMKWNMSAPEILSAMMMKCAITENVNLSV